MTSELKVRLVREIAAPREAVYNAWLDPVLLARFLKPAPGVTVIDEHVDAREGGELRLTMIAGETRIPIRGVYRRIDRFDRLEFTWLSSRTLESSLVRLRFDEVGPERTRLTLEHVGFSDEASRRDHEGGWGGVLDELALALAGIEDS